MSKLSEVIFLDSYPKLDLHGYEREIARVAINDFINDNQKMGKEIIVIVHGIGQGILKEQTINTLNKNKEVIDFQTGYFNHGCTVAQIKKLTL